MTTSSSIFSVSQGKENWFDNQRVVTQWTESGNPCRFNGWTTSHCVKLKSEIPDVL
jgi:hypothetical protein